MVSIWEKTISILAGNLISGRTAVLCHFFVMRLFCYEIQLGKEFADVCIFCGSFIINSFWTHLSYVLKTGRRLFWKNEAKVRKKAWVISSIMAKLEMSRISTCKSKILLPFGYTPTNYVFPRSLGCQKVCQDPLNTLLEVWCANIAS